MMLAHLSFVIGLGLLCSAGIMFVRVIGGPRRNRIPKPILLATQQPEAPPQPSHSTPAQPTPAPCACETTEPVISEHSREQARLSFVFSEYKEQDDQRDPVDSLNDAELLLYEARRLNQLLTDPALRHQLAKRLEWVLRHPADPKTVAIAELLVAHNQERCAKLGILDLNTTA